MTYHLSVVEIIHEINQQNTLLFQKPAYIKIEHNSMQLYPASSAWYEALLKILDNHDQRRIILTS
ncbi:MAG: hypothetical protein ACTS73_01825 [Arsenophonus sp. NEOnobi-MAG3]